MDSDLRKKLREALPGDQKGREDLQRLTGIDVERDIDRVVAAVGASGEQSTVAFVTGRFNPTQIEALAREHGASVVDYGGKRLLTGMGEEEGRKQHGPAALAFLEPNVLAIGAEAAVRKAIDTQASGNNITTNEGLMKIISSVSAGNNVWAVGSMASFQDRIPAEVSSRMPAVEWFAATGRVNGGIHATLRAEARDDQAAEYLRDIVRGGLALIKMQSGDPQFAALANSIRLEGSGKTVSVSFSVPAELIDLLIAQGPRGLVPIE
jgi:hypothetical protein